MDLHVLLDLFTTMSQVWQIEKPKKNPEKVNFVVYHNVSILNVAILSLSL